MRRIFVTVILCIVSLVLGMLARGMYNNYAAGSKLTEEARRASYLMPQKDSPTWKDWTAKYGDTADSWELFSIAFHTRYLGELNQRITKLEKARDVNEPNQPAKTN